MATIAEMFVNIGANTDGFEHQINRMQRQFNNLARDMERGTSGINREFANMSPQAQASFQRMREAMEANRDKMREFRAQQMDVTASFYDMAAGAQEFQGTTDEFMASIQELGATQKKITEQMAANNQIALAGYYQQVGALLNASSQASKIMKQYDTMPNPLYQVNDAFLSIADSLNSVATNGAPAVLALRMLGPTANMYQLQQMVMLINAGLMRFQMVAMFALAANALMFAGLHSAAKESVPGYKKAVEEMGGAIKQAFQPMVDVFAMVMVPIFKFITAIANMAIAFNEAHPTLAKIIQGFLLLIPVLTLILAPLAVGIGLFNGMAAVFNMVWMTIGPLVTGLAAMMGTVLVVAGAVALLVAGLVYLWKTSETFRNVITSGWEAIKAAAITVWNFIYNSILVPVINAIVTFVQDKLSYIKDFWAENGEMILQAAQNVWNVISKVIEVAMGIILAVMKVVWPIIKTIVSVVWDSIKTLISGAIDVILGVIKFFSALFTGNWSKMWEATKQIIWGAISAILAWLSLTFFGGIGKGIAVLGTTMRAGFTTAWNFVKSVFSGGISTVTGLVTKGFNGIVNFIKGLGTTFFNAGKGLIDMIAKGITSAVSGVVNAVKGVASKIRNFLPFSPAKEGPLSDLDKLDFGGPISDSIKWGLPGVQSLMAKMLTMPDINTNATMALAGAGATAAPINLTLNYNGSASESDVMTMMDLIEKELDSRINTSLRFGGVKE